MVSALAARGWTRFGWDAGIAAWVEAALPHAIASMEDPALAEWWDCEDTWFIGVDALHNDESGAVSGQPLAGQAIDFIHEAFGAMPPLHRAQVSVVRPGYPRPRRGESEAGFRYRDRRFAAHVDGLKFEGPDRRRTIAEPHAFILGIPMNDAPAHAAPLVIWEGSHEVIRAGMADFLKDVPRADWGRVDITDAYVTARKRAFETCPMVEVHARPGECYLMHRLAVHGVKGWEARREGDPENRIIAYFRPEIAGGAEAWLDQP